MLRREASGLLYPILGQKAVVIDERDPLATGVLHTAKAGRCEALLPLGNHVQGNAIGPQILLHNSLRIVCAIVVDYEHAPRHRWRHPLHRD